ncbi:hypothetical protein BN1723_013801 [Verticillium longisporum]|uniref:Cytochrome P450 n=1 Tax=Verticillium longisporum TaxID=100787 RepID=A0A0G4LVY0_VERLO|nr:hypothetical protein BN1723_013801 [Verticillium longisporum]
MLGQVIEPTAVSFALIFLFVKLASYLHQAFQKDHGGSLKGFSHASAAISPPNLRSQIPYIGHIIGYMRQGNDYFSNLCLRLSNKRPIFTLNMAGIQLVMVQPELRRHLPKTKHLQLNHLVATMFRRSLSFGDHSCSLLKEEFDLSRGFGADISRIFRGEFIPNLNLRKYIDRLDSHFETSIDTLQEQGSGTLRVEEWVFSTFVGALGKALWDDHAGEGPFADAAFLADMRIMLLNIRQLNSPLSFLLNPRAVSARKSIRKALQDDASQTSHLEDSFLGRLRAACAAHGAREEDWTDYQLLLIAGAGPNVTAASTWMIHHLLACPEWLALVREEVDSFVGTEESHIDLADVPSKCPRLLATWHEVLRYHGGMAICRYVQEDTTLGEDWRLQKGSYLMTPLRPHHVDPQVWGPTAVAFDPSRFLKADGGVDESQRKKMRMFGLFGSLCPGRFLAVNTAMAFVIRFISSVELHTLDGCQHSVPTESVESVAGLPTPAWDMEVGWTKREEIARSVRFCFKK